MGKVCKLENYLIIIKGNQYILQMMMKELALDLILLSLEIILFIRIHLFLVTEKLKIVKKQPYWQVEKDEKEKKELPGAKQMLASAIHSLLDIQWKDENQMRGQVRKMNNICLYTITVAFNLIFFRPTYFHVLINFLLLNRWLYLIKGMNDNKLYIIIHSVFIFHFFSRDVLSEYYIILLNRIISTIFPWKRNLLTILALNFAKETNEKPYYNEKYEILKKSQIHLQHLHLHEQQIVEHDTFEICLIFVMIFQFVLQQIQNNKTQKQFMRLLNIIMVPAFVYLIYFENYHFLTNAMLFSHIFQAIDEKYFKEQFY